MYSCEATFVSTSTTFLSPSACIETFGVKKKRTNVVMHAFFQKLILLETGVAYDRGGPSPLAPPLRPRLRAGSGPSYAAVSRYTLTDKPAREQSGPTGQSSIIGDVPTGGGTAAEASVADSPSRPPPPVPSSAFSTG